MGKELTKKLMYELRGDQLRISSKCLTYNPCPASLLDLRVTPVSIRSVRAL